MRFGIKAKQIAGVTAIVGVAVVALSALNVARLARVVLGESHARALLLSNAIFHRAFEVVAPGPDPYAALRDDPGLRSILESSIYGQSVTSAAILDPQGVVVAHSDRAFEGGRQLERGDLAALLDRSAIEQIRVIYTQGGQTLELRRPMVLGDEAFGSIRIGVSTLLMRQELSALLQPAIWTAAGALGIGVFVAALLAQLLLRPIHVIRSGLTRLGRGEFGVTLDLPPGDEFGELGSFFNSVSQQLSADRSRLAGQHASLQSAVEHLEDAVALFNPAGELLFSNPAMQPILPAAAIGQNFRSILPQEHPYVPIVQEALATRRSKGPVQTHVVAPRPSSAASRTERDRDADAKAETKDTRTPGDHLMMTHAITGRSGELVGVLLVVRDLAYLSRMQSTLAYSRKLVALGRLTAGIAHEVKNPLHAMMIHLELLRTKIKSGFAATQPEPEAVAASGGGLGLTTASRVAALSPAAEGALKHVAIIESEIRRLDEVVQGFLKFTRPEDLRLQPVTLSSLFEEIRPLVEPEAKTNNVRIVVDCPPTLPSVNADASMLRQAFLNLALNACQAMPAGGTLRMIAAPAARDRVEVRFEDTGVGIPPEHLGKIFDLYFTTKDHGTGIGLSMVYRIVQLHDGDVEVQSTPGRGTTFRLLLPRAREV
jgi:signal transduction histidine kinase